MSADRVTDSGYRLKIAKGAMPLGLVRCQYVGG